MEIVAEMEPEGTVEGGEEILNEDTTRDWKEGQNRVIGHIFLSPPIGLNVGDEGFTEDWAVIEIDASKIDATSFVGNAVGLGIVIPIEKFTSWMYPYPTNPSSLSIPMTVF